MATIRDVARRAGVAPSTVSYALSGRRPISKEARSRIATAIDELEFTPSALGRGLANQRSNMVGLVFPVAESELTWETLDFLPTASNALSKRGYGLSVFTGSMTPQRILNLCRENVVDGLILMQVTHHDERVEILRRTRYPMVLIGRCADLAGLSVVDYDTERAVYLVFEHLALLGHRHIGYLDLPRHKLREQLGFARLIQSGVARARRDLDVIITREEIDGTIEVAYRATHKLFQRAPALSALVSVHGATPIGVLRAARQLGRSIPGDCSLSCVGRSSWSLWSSPQLTSADIPLNGMVRTACDLILEQLTGTESEQQVILPAAITVRESTAPRHDPARETASGALEAPIDRP